MDADKTGLMHDPGTSRAPQKRLIFICEVVQHSLFSVRSAFELSNSTIGRSMEHTRLPEKMVAMGRSSLLQ